jgi:hypothetical protein
VFHTGLVLVGLFSIMFDPFGLPWFNGVYVLFASWALCFFAVANRYATETFLVASVVATKRLF